MVDFLKHLQYEQSVCFVAFLGPVRTRDLHLESPFCSRCMKLGPCMTQSNEQTDLSDFIKLSLGLAAGETARDSKRFLLPIVTDDMLLALAAKKKRCSRIELDARGALQSSSAAVLCTR